MHASPDFLELQEDQLCKGSGYSSGAFRPENPSGHGPTQLNTAHWRSPGKAWKIMDTYIYVYRNKKLLAAPCIATNGALLGAPGRDLDKQPRLSKQPRGMG